MYHLFKWIISVWYHLFSSPGMENQEPERYNMISKGKRLKWNGYFFPKIYTVCPRSSDPFYVVTYCIKWVTTSWKYSIPYNLSNCNSFGYYFSYCLYFCLYVTLVLNLSVSTYFCISVFLSLCLPYLCFYVFLYVVSLIFSTLSYSPTPFVFTFLSLSLSRTGGWLLMISC